MLACGFGYAPQLATSATPFPHPPCPPPLPSPAPQVGVFASAESSQAAEMVDVLCKEMEVQPGATGQKQFSGEGSLACCSHIGERASMAGC